ncbi:MAG: alpha-2-macroglobulin [Gammaproteobacteria bacterium]|nr:alpha-2-macroglobulin [Gammaproteobacteria bacterium]
MTTDTVKITRQLLASVCIGLALCLVPVQAPAAELVDNTLQPRDTVLVPDTFLRSWDPVTIFFKDDRGAAAGLPEDNPERLIRVEPQHPGAYTWLNESTLQFRPAEAWPPLSRYRWQVDGSTVDLTTLMSAPYSSRPANGARDLNRVDDITLTFATPIDPVILKQMLRIEVRELPGIETSNAYWLKPDDFEIKVIERSSPTQAASYVINLKKPVGSGFVIKIHLRLSLDDSLDESFYQISFSTARPFAVRQLGCSGSLYPITANGSRYDSKQAIQCNSSNRNIQVEFSAGLGEVDPIAARNLVHVTPAIENISYSASGNTLMLRGDFETEQLYQVNLQPYQMVDANHRPLSINAGSELFLYFPEQSKFLDWKTAQGIIERFGPQMLPLKGRGYDRMDLRIHPIDPLDRSFWPFPKKAVVIDEQSRPEAPGEMPTAYTDRKRNVSNGEIRRQIKSLGAPSISEIVLLPLKHAGNEASFGLDLKPYMERMQKPRQPGTYLVGMRVLDQSTQRHWVRIQVTDLSLSTVREPEHARFVVTSLQTGMPVSGAHIIVEGNKGNILEAVTDRQGQYRWIVPKEIRDKVRRIIVKKDDDLLLLDPDAPPQTYVNNLWRQNNDTWLDWARYVPDDYQGKGQDVCHIFTERPVYKPDHTVHIKAYLRNVTHGKFGIKSLEKPNFVIRGPGNLEWIYPLENNGLGSFYHAFLEDKLPSGNYNVRLKYNGGSCGSVSFKKEAYRLPRFEVTLNGPDKTGVDQPFEIKLSSEYYAGGPVADRPVRWRVTQFPYSWTPKKRDGFFYSTDARFSNQSGFKAQPLSFPDVNTDEFGGANISIDPTRERSSQARRYVVEATVTGADDQTVTNTFETRALPPLALGLKIPRYSESLDDIYAEILVTDQNDEIIQGQSVTLRLQQRQWHSHLQAADYSQGTGKYITEVVDETIFETRLASANEISRVRLPIDKAGVYIVEIEALDKLDRLQTVKVDMFAGGDEPVTWSRQPTQVFKVTPEKKKYAPGEIARLILESPYQRARALAIVEQADGVNRYDWINVRNGSAVYEVPINKTDMPRLPVHFLLMRGRIEQNKISNLDLGKPSALAATTLIEVDTVEHQVSVALDYPKKVQPGDEIEVTIKLSDEDGKPLDGEVTLWLVDQSVLALGREQRLDPIPDFIPHRDAYTSLRDTRNLALGFFPYQEQPGGGVGAMMASEMAQALIDNVTLRKNFSPVPYFNPGILVDDSGQVTVKVKMPDNLTNFKLRAKTVHAADRFGFGIGSISVRLPVIVQPSLPRFVRPGDSFTAIAIGRVVEGGSGDGRAEIKLDGLELIGDSQKDFVWDKNTPQRIEYAMRVPTPGYDDLGKIEKEQVRVTVAVERSSDNARDAFQLDLPIRSDRQAVSTRKVLNLSTGQAQTLDAIAEPVRQGTLRRSLLISSQAGLLHMVSGLNYLIEYPHGCTEQRLSRARAVLASSRFDELLNKTADDDWRDKIVTDTLAWIEQVVDEKGLMSYWPGSRGYVSLTAWSTMFMLEARKAGYPVEEALLDNSLRALRQSMRSDYTYYIDGAAFEERSWALTALAMAGESVGAYAAELARRSEYLNLESLAQVVVALSQGDQYSTAQLEALYDRLWQSIVFRLHRGAEIYGGLQSGSLSTNSLILPSETRAVAETLRAVSHTPVPLQSEQMQKRRQQLLDAIVGLGRGDGWGNTNANAAALLSLSDFLSTTQNPSTLPAVLVKGSGEEHRYVFEQKPLISTLLQGQGELNLTLDGNPGESSIVVLSDTRYTPALDGSHAEASANGFVVTREMLKILGSDQPPQRLAIDQAAQTYSFEIGDVVEEHVELVNPRDGNHVAIIVPLAAGMEPLNPALATAPPEASPDGVNTLEPSYLSFADDQMAYYYDALPKGSYNFYFRTRATIPGSYIQPAAYAEMMYDQAVNGHSNGARIVVSKKPAQ